MEYREEIAIKVFFPSAESDDKVPAIRWKFGNFWVIEDSQ